MRFSKLYDNSKSALSKHILDNGMLAIGTTLTLAVVPVVFAQQANEGSFDYLGNTTFPTGYRYVDKSEGPAGSNGWRVAGLSGIDFNPGTGQFVTVTDNWLWDISPNGDLWHWDPVFMTLQPVADGSQGYGLEFTGVIPLYIVGQEDRTRMDSLEGVRYDPRDDSVWAIGEQDSNRLYHWHPDDSRSGVTMPDTVTGDGYNKAMEGLTITASGQIWIAAEGTKGGDPALVSRISQVDPQGNVLAQYAYRREDMNDNGVSEILSIDEHRFLVMERAWDGTSADAEPQGVSHNSIRIYQVDVDDGTEIKDQENLDDNVQTLAKSLIFDSASLDDVLNTYASKVDNIEGMTFGPRLRDGRATLVLVSDNNDSDTQAKTQFLVFAVDGDSPIPLSEVDLMDQSQIQKWQGGDGQWDATAQNWGLGEALVAHDAGKWSIFAGEQGHRVTLDASSGEITTQGLYFMTDGYRLDGDALTLEQPATEIKVGDSAIADASTLEATLANPLSGSGGVDKTGLGTLTLTGDSDYSGATQVDAGTLVVEGSLASAVTVAKGATLSGSGTVAAASLESGATLDPAGSQVGAFGIGGTLKLARDAQLTVDIDGTAIDTVHAGSIQLDGGSLWLRSDGDGSDIIIGTPYRILSADTSLSGTLDGVGGSSTLVGLLGYDDRSAWLTFDRTSEQMTPLAYTKSLVDQYDALRQNHPEIAGPLYPDYWGGWLGDVAYRDDHNMQVVRDYQDQPQWRKDLAYRDNTNYDMNGEMTSPALDGSQLGLGLFGHIAGEYSNAFMSMGSESPGELHIRGKDVSQSPRPNNISIDSGGVPGGSHSDSSSYPSGHTAKGTGANLLAAYMYPERFQPFINRGQQYGESRVVLGVHYPLDVMASRAMTYKAAADLLAEQVPDPDSWLNRTADPVGNRAWALGDRCGGLGMAECVAAPDNGWSVNTWDKYQSNLDYYNYTTDYGFGDFLKEKQITLAADDEPMVVPKNAEYLIWTRYPYLDAYQKREIIRTTAYPSGRVLDDPWSRINLFAAAEGYGRFDRNVIVNMETANAADDTQPGAGFNAADRWRNDIDGDGALIKRGDGVLTLGGNNSFGGFSLQGGGLIFSQDSGDDQSGINQLSGNVWASAGVLEVDGTLRTEGYLQLGQDSTLTLVEATLGAEKALDINAATTLTGSNTIEVGAGNGTISGAISGTGGLSKTGSGTLTLSGSNSYQGTTEVQQGLLSLAGGTLGGAVNVAEKARFGGSGSAGDIHIGSGGHLAPGRSRLIGTLGATRVNFADGAFYDVDVNRLGADRTDVSDTVSIGEDVTVAVTAGSGYQLSTPYRILDAEGGIEGQFAQVTENFAYLDASLDQSDGRNVILTLNRTGSDNGSEQTRDEPEPLDPTVATWEIDSTAQLGTHVLDFKGNVLASNASLTLDNALTFDADGGTLRPAADTSLTLTGLVSGTGTLTKQGLGYLILDGAADYSGYRGDIQIESGRLAVNGVLGNSSVNVASGAILGGNGLVGTTFVNGNGHLAPGNSIDTFTVKGDLTLDDGSFYDVEVDGEGAADRTDVDGKVTIGDDVTVVVTPEGSSSSYQDSTEYRILSANGGIDGEFAGVSELAFLDGTLRQDDSDLYLTLERKGSGSSSSGDLRFAEVVFTPNQKATANAVESLGSSHSLYNAVLYLPDGAPAKAFDQLSGVLYPALADVLTDQAAAGRGLLNRRLYSAFGESNASSGAASQQIAGDQRGGAWFEVMGGHADYDDNDNIPGVSFDRGRGLLLGVDGESVAPGAWRLGVAAGASSADIDLKGSHASADLDSYHLGIYAGTQLGPVEIHLGTMQSWHEIDSKRRITLSSYFSQRLEADYDATTRQVFAEAALNLDTGAVRWQPYVGLARVDVDGDAFTEKGGSAALAVADVDQAITYASSGLRASSDFTVGETRTYLGAGIGWQHAIEEPKASQHLAFASGGDAFKIRSAGLDRNSLSLELQGGLQLSPRTTLGVSYTGAFGDDSRNQSLNAQLQVRF